MQRYIKLNMVLMIPVWLLTFVICPILNDKHPMKAKPPTLRDWATGGTDLAGFLAGMLWASWLGAIAAIIYLVMR